MNSVVKLKLCFTNILYLLIVTLYFVNTLYAEDPSGEKNKQRLHKVTTNDTYQSFTINNFFNYYSNNGDGSYNPYKGMSGLEFPKGSGNTAVFEDGFLIGGKTRTSISDPTQIIKVGGSAYRHGWQAGRIVTPGTSTTNAVADNPALPANRIFKVRSDITPSTPTGLAKDIIEAGELPLVSRFESGATVQTIYDQYISDWNEWPASEGAPFTDNNNNGTYEPAVDVPGVSGADQTLWHVSNDLDAAKTKFLYGSDPIGIELQRTIWGYRYKGALGNTIFTKYKIINKSGAIFDKAYVAQWSDPDLGEPGNDITGCDTLLSLGFVYNGTIRDAVYGSNSPALGYDFFQGPLVNGLPSDSGKVNGRYVRGKKNLPMTAFNFTYSGNVINNNMPSPYDGTIQWYRQMQGLNGNTGAPIHEYFDILKPTTSFTVSGDPVTGLGWLDGVYNPPSDRRMWLCSGPFTMANGDTQEIVVGTIIAQDGDRLSSVSALKSYDKAAQFAYDHNFISTGTPPSVTVTVINGDGEIVLDWGNEKFAKMIESYNSNGYKFQGYNIYQSPSANYSPATAKRLATFDIVDGVGIIKDEVFDNLLGTTIVKPVQFGSDYGIQRTYTVKIDTFTGKALVNGRSYYFSVTAYCYNPDPYTVPKSFENGPMQPEAIPQSRPPGVRYEKNIGDTLRVTHSSGICDGAVYAIVVDPKKLTGHDYSVTFDSLPGYILCWKLTDVTTGKVLLDKQYNISGDNDYFTVDGMLIKVTGVSKFGVRGWSIPNGKQVWTWIDGDGLGFEGFNGAIGWDEPAYTFGSIPIRTVPASDVRNVLIKYATAASGTITNGIANCFYADTAAWNASTDPNFSYGYRYVRGGTFAPARPEFTPYVGANAGVTSNYGFGGYNKNTVPFSAWNTETNPPTRLAVGFLENNVTTGLVDGRYWSYPNGSGSNNAGASRREWFFIFATPYTDAVPNNAYKVSVLINPLPIMYTGTVMRLNGANQSAGDEFMIFANHGNTVNDVFRFTAPAPTSSIADAKADVEKINVFPNPYFRFNSQETSPSHRFITFNHLPQKATIRIFTLAGILVKTITKDDAMQFVQWDLRNNASNAASAGMYIVHIDMPEIGKAKILKLAVIPSAQIVE
ncbi:MAG: T9SS type A sorting domain-containing protein [Bacteroidota bacterium]|nr:T9SS type A sorting domain-containing protein [Bacteroidota bacterium]